MNSNNDPWIICPACHGDGTHVNPNIDAHGLTAEDFAQDPDFADAYWRGDYDIQCNVCHGPGKIRQSLLKQLHDNAAERRERALEDGDPEGYSIANDYRYG